MHRMEEERRELLRLRRDPEQRAGRGAIARRDEIDSSIATIDGRREATRQQLLALRRGARSEEITAAEARVSGTTAAILAIGATQASTEGRTTGAP